MMILSVDSDVTFMVGLLSRNRGPCSKRLEDPHFQCTNEPPKWICQLRRHSCIQRHARRSARASLGRFDVNQGAGCHVAARFICIQSIGKVEILMHDLMKQKILALLETHRIMTIATL